MFHLIHWHRQHFLFFFFFFLILMYTITVYHMISTTCSEINLALGDSSYSYKNRSVGIGMREVYQLQHIHINWWMRMYNIVRTLIYHLELVFLLVYLIESNPANEFARPEYGRKHRRWDFGPKFLSVYILLPFTPLSLALKYSLTLFSSSSSLTFCLSPPCRLFYGYFSYTHKI